MKQRVAYLVIDGKRFGNQETGLNVTFDVPYTGTNLVPNNSTFTLTNVNNSDLKYIVTNTARFTERKRAIECWAGYSGKVKKIFSGQILQASPTDMPDTIINITALSNIANMGEYVINKSFADITFFDLLQDAAQECGYGLNISESVRNSEKLQASAGKEWSFGSGSAFDYLQRVETDLAIHIDQSKQALAFSVANDVLYVSWQGELHPSTVPIINKRNGMVGIPTPTEAGINLQVLLDVTLNPLQTIRVESERLSLYNGLYTIINIRHHGSLRGRDWYSDLECVKVGK